MGSDEAVEAFGQDVIDGVDELFHVILPPRAISAFAGDARYPLDEFVDGAVERGILFGVAEIGHRQRDMPDLAKAGFRRCLSGMRDAVGRQKSFAFLRAEMADR